MSVTLPNGQLYNVSTRRYNQAPLPAITVADAIADLPEFDFENPCKVYEMDGTPSALQNYPSIKVEQYKGYAGKMECDYTKKPRSDYQVLRRKNSNYVHNHVTRAFNPLAVERIVRVRMKPGADHSSKCLFINSRFA